VEVQLFSDKTPLACENFRALCTGELNKGYSSSLVHRIVPNFCIQGGDFTKGDGTGGESIYPPNSEHGDMWGKFKDEFFMQHNQKGLLSMANNGKNRNGSQFFVTLAPLPHLDGKHVVFGKVTMGMNVVEAISQTPTDKNQRPLERVVISGCGEVRNGEDCFVEPSMISQGQFSSVDESSATPFGSNDPKASPFSVYTRADKPIESKASPFSFSSASDCKPFSFGGFGATKPCSFVAPSPASPVKSTPLSFSNTKLDTEIAAPSMAFNLSNSKPATEEAAPPTAFNFTKTKPSTKNRFVPQTR
jgi:cyclophilin family peptidyl-prolyl cis-trans isomerase